MKKVWKLYGIKEVEFKVDFNYNKDYIEGSIFIELKTFPTLIDAEEHISQIDSEYTSYKEYTIKEIYTL